MKWSIDSESTRSGKVMARVLLGKEPVGMLFLYAAERDVFEKVLTDGTELLARLNEARDTNAERDKEIARIRGELEAMQETLGRQVVEDAEAGLAEPMKAVPLDRWKQREMERFNLTGALSDICHLVGLSRPVGREGTARMADWGDDPQKVVEAVRAEMDDLAERCRSEEADLEELKAALAQTRGKLVDAETRAILAEDRARKRSNDDFDAGAQDLADDLSEALGVERGVARWRVVELVRQARAEVERLKGELAEQVASHRITIGERDQARACRAAELEAVRGSGGVLTREECLLICRSEPATSGFDDLVLAGAALTMGAKVEAAPVAAAPTHCDRPACVAARKKIKDQRQALDDLGKARDREHEWFTRRLEERLAKATAAPVLGRVVPDTHTPLVRVDHGAAPLPPLPDVPDWLRAYAENGRRVEAPHADHVAVFVVGILDYLRAREVPRG